MLRTLIKSSLFKSTRLFECESTHLTRHRCYQDLRSSVSGFPHERVASISGSETLCEIVGFRADSVFSLNYPDYDASRLPHVDGYFDACVMDQVLEHVEAGPERALDEMARVTRRGGLLISATVMTYPLHHGPKDLWRFTPDGHRALLDAAGYKVMREESWGGRAAVVLLALDCGLLPVPKNRAHPLRKIAEATPESWPIVVWAICERI